jgi:hypothetical protein
MIITPRSLIAWPIPRGGHHRDDLLHRRRVRRMAKALVARHATLVKARQRCRRPATSGTVQQSYRFHDVLLWTMTSPTILPPPDGRLDAECAYPRLGGVLLLGTGYALTAPHRVVAQWNRML